MQHNMTVLAGDILYLAKKNIFFSQDPKPYETKWLVKNNSNNKHFTISRIEYDTLAGCNTNARSLQAPCHTIRSTRR